MCGEGTSVGGRIMAPRFSPDPEIPGALSEERKARTSQRRGHHDRRVVQRCLFFLAALVGVRWTGLFALQDRTLPLSDITKNPSRLDLRRAASEVGR